MGLILCRIFDAASESSQLRGIGFAYDGMHSAFTHTNIGSLTIHVRLPGKRPGQEEERFELQLNGPVKELSLDSLERESLQAVDIVMGSVMDKRCVVPVHCILCGPYS